MGLFAKKYKVHGVEMQGGRVIIHLRGGYEVLTLPVGVMSELNLQTGDTIKVKSKDLGGGNELIWWVEKDGKRWNQRLD